MVGRFPKLIGRNAQRLTQSLYVTSSDRLYSSLMGFSLLLAHRATDGKPKVVRRSQVLHKVEENRCLASALLKDCKRSVCSLSIHDSSVIQAFGYLFYICQPRNDTLISDFSKLNLQCRFDDAPFISRQTLLFTVVVFLRTECNLYTEYFWIASLDTLSGYAPRGWMRASQRGQAILA